MYYSKLQRQSMLVNANARFDTNLEFKCSGVLESNLLIYAIYSKQKGKDLSCVRFLEKLN